MIRAALGWRRNWPDYAVEPEPEAEPEESFAFRMNTETPEHIWDDQYVGNQFLGEMIEQWYRTANFVMHSYNRPEPMFLDTQQVQAVMQHIPRLTIDIVDYNGLGGSHTTTPEVLDEIVDMVVLLVQGTRVGIHFHYEGSGGCVWDGGVQALERHCHFASLVVPWYQKARDAGYNVSLRIGDVDCKIVAGVSAPDDWITALRDQWQREYDLLKKWEEGEMEGLL